MKRLFWVIALAISCVLTQAKIYAQKRIVIDGLCYSLEKGTASVQASTEDKYAGEIVIPPFIQDVDGSTYKVTSIGSESFLKCDKLTSVSFPATLERIDSWAFGFCKLLKNISFPVNIKEVHNTAFYGCTGLPVIDGLRYADRLLVETVDRSRKKYKILDGTRWIGANSMSNLPFVEKIVLPSSIEVIGHYAFTENKSLEKVVLGGNEKKIEHAAFSYCPCLKKISLPSSVTYVSSWVFSGCVKCEDDMIKELKEKHLYREFPE